MTASWRLESTTADNERVSLHFYSGPSATPPSYIRLVGSVLDDSGDASQTFNNLYDADDWAAGFGVQRWKLTQHSRAFPEAARIPIEFAEAPDDERLAELIRGLEAGIPLSELAQGILVNAGDHQFQVRPDLLRLWLIGASPDHPALQRQPKRG